MISRELLALLCCPESGQRLAEASEEQLTRINELRSAGILHNRAGRAVIDPVDAALVRADGTLFFPIHGGIPVLLLEEALALNGQ